MASPSGKKIDDPILRFEPEGIALLKHTLLVASYSRKKGGMIIVTSLRVIMWRSPNHSPRVLMAKRTNLGPLHYR